MFSPCDNSNPQDSIHAAPSPWRNGHEQWMGITSLRLRGQINLANAEQLEHRLRALSNKAGSTLVIDTRELTFIGAIGIGVLVRVAAELRLSGGGMKIAYPPVWLTDLIRTLNLDPVLEVIEAPQPYALHEPLECCA